MPDDRPTDPTCGSALFCRPRVDARQNLRRHLPVAQQCRSISKNGNARYMLLRFFCLSSEFVADADSDAVTSDADLVILFATCAKTESYIAVLPSFR